MYIRRSYHHPGQAAVSSYLGAPGSSPAERMREDAELELGAPSEGKDAVFESGVFGERYRVKAQCSQEKMPSWSSAFPAREKILCLSPRFSRGKILGRSTAFPREEAELELGVPSKEKDAVSKCEIFGGR